MKWKKISRCWPFVREIHRSPVNSPHKGQWRGALMFSLICVWINCWVKSREAGDLRHNRAHYDAIVMYYPIYMKVIAETSKQQNSIMTQTTCICLRCASKWLTSWNSLIKVSCNHSSTLRISASKAMRVFMPPPLGAGGIMFSGCPSVRPSIRPSVRPSEAWNTLFWPVHRSVGPPDQP